MTLELETDFIVLGIFSYKVLPLDIKVVLLRKPQETRANALLNRKS